MVSDHIIYSKHFPTKSDIYAIPVERIANISNEPDIFDYSSWFASQSWQVGDPINPYGEMDISGASSNVTDPIQRTEYMNMNLNPYKKKLENGPVIRYLYTGREYNVETGDYYYRARMLDSSIGRFSGKDPILYLNLYRYVKNNPMHHTDPSGKYYKYRGPHSPSHTYPGWQIFVTWSVKYGWPALIAGHAMYFGVDVFDASMMPGYSAALHGGAGADNPDYMQEINKCDNQEANCNNCCETASGYPQGSERFEGCISNCGASAGECKRQVDEKYGGGRSRNPINVGALWNNSGQGWNCWDDCSTKPEVEGE